MFAVAIAELQALLLSSPKALAKFNTWAQSVSGQKYFEKGNNTPPFVRSFNTDFRLDVRRVARWGFPPYYRVWFLDHLPTKQSMSYDSRNGDTVSGDKGEL